MDKALVSFLTDINHHMLVASKILGINKVIALIEQGNEVGDKLEVFQEHIKENLPGLVIEYFNYSCNEASLIGVLNKISSKYDIVIDATNGPTLPILLLNNFVSQNLVPIIYVDIDQKVYYYIKGEKIAKHQGFAELKIEDIMAGSGTSIVSSSTQYYQSEDILDYINVIENNYIPFRTFQSIMKTPARVRANYPSDFVITVSLNYLSEEDKNEFIHIASQLQYMKLIDYELKDLNLYMHFKNLQFRNIIMTAGSWLEAITYNCVKHIEAVDDAESGVVFMWDADLINITNEIDVMAALDSRLVYISCKDTQNLNTYMLNEIELYAEKLGGQDAIKIMVLSDKPTNEVFVQRAVEMGIQVIYFNGNTKIFENTLSKAFYHAKI